MRPRFHQHWQRGLSYPALDRLVHLLYHYFEGSDPTPIYGLPNLLRFGFSIRLRYARSVKVGEVLEKLHEDGWFLIATKGSHRQFKHGTKPGRVTVAGKPSDDLPPGTLNSIFKQAGWKKGAL